MPDLQTQPCAAFAPLEPSEETRIEALEAENRDCARRYRALVERNGELVELAIASQRLHEARSRREVFLAIEVIFANLFATRELAVFEVEAGMLRLVTGLGAASQLDSVPVGSGPIGKVAASGVLYLAEDRVRRKAWGELGDLELAAVVPLRVGDGVIGVVVALRPPNTGWEAQNRDLLDLLSRQSALALWSAVIDAPPSMRTTRRFPGKI